MVSEQVPFVGDEGTDEHGYPLQKPDKAVVMSALLQRRFDLLERWMDFYQSEFEHDFRKESWPDTMLWAFLTADAALDAPLDAWVAHSPKHYAAWAARGVHRFGAGAYYRGDGFAHQTSFMQRHKQAELYELAAADFAEALALKPNLVSVYRRLLQIPQAKHAQGQRGWFAEGLKHCRLCYGLRVSYINFALTPRWGGSVAKMKNFISALGPLVKENPKLGVLAGYIDWDRCRTLAEDNKQAAMTACDAALRFGEDPLFLYQRSRLLDAKKDPRAVLPFLERGLRLAPQDLDLLARRCFARMQDPATYVGAAQDMVTVRRIDPMNEVQQKNWQFLINSLWREGGKLAAASKHAQAIEHVEVGLLLAPSDHNLGPALAASRAALAGPH